MFKDPFLNQALTSEQGMISALGILIDKAVACFRVQDSKGSAGGGV